jgi:GNAT superfamily N-acetyltransferase
MSDPLIRPGTMEDLPELARLRWQLYREYEPDLDEPFESFSRRFVAFAAEVLGRPEWRVWVAEDEGGLVGTMWVQAVPRVPAPGRPEPSPMGYLTNCYVERPLRSRGLGSRMLAGILEHCRSEGFELMFTFPADPAYAFYERSGFERRPDPLVHPLRGVP